MPAPGNPRPRDTGSRVIFVAADDDKVELPRLRRRALAALNLGLPPTCDDDDPALDRVSISFKCSCLKRSGRCTCTEDRSWLQSKRREASIYVPPHLRSSQSSSAYVPPHLRRASDAAAAEKDDSNQVASLAAKRKKEWEDSIVDISQDSTEEPLHPHCICLRRGGRCSCPADNVWLQRKRRCIVPYVPPHMKARQAELERQQGKTVSAPESEEPQGGATRSTAASEKGSTASGGSLNVRVLARQWGKSLENRGECRFNPMQMDGQFELDDTDGLVAECTEYPLSTKGVKALPVIRGGRYHYEIELLRDGALIVGWSGAMTLPGQLDFQGYGYSSRGGKWHGQDKTEGYGAAFGKAGDVVGALLSWTEHDAVEISFCLNGRSLGTAFQIGSATSKEDVPIPLQPHLLQLPHGAMLQVRLRGSRPDVPLKYPVNGYLPLCKASDKDFCPFSAAVSAASAERTVASLSPEQLRSFHIADNHIVELYDMPAGCTAKSILSSVSSFLGLTPSEDMLHMRFTESDGATALLACRRLAHTRQLVAIMQESSAVEASQSRSEAVTLPFAVRPLCSATASSRAKLRDWRGEEFRPQADCSAARRLIHGCLQSQMPLSHIVDEKNRKSTQNEKKDQKL